MSTRLILEADREGLAIIDREGYTFTLSPEDSHYLTHVLRTPKGSSLTVVNAASGAELLVAIESLGKYVNLEVKKITTAKTITSPVSALIYPLTKGSTLDLVLEKGVELGVPLFAIWQADRSVVRLGSEEDIEKKLERWRKILRAAAQQSLKNSVATISLHKNLADCVDTTSKEAPSELVVCSLDASALPIASIAKQDKRYQLIVGPEGDFSEGEERFLSDQRFIKASLGPYRLRSETAAICAVSMVNGIIGFSTSNDTR